MKEFGDIRFTSTEPSDDDRHRFLGYLMPQLDPLRKAVERNWVSQTVLIALAGFHLYYNSAAVGGFKVVIVGVTLGTIPFRALDVAFPLVLTYLVIRLGYLLNAYIFIRTGIMSALQAFTTRTQEFQDDNAQRMLRANSLVELFCLEYKWKNVGADNAALVILPFILSAILALNHVFVLFYLRLIYGYRPIVAITLAIILGAAMISCYVHFLRTPTRQLGAKMISIATIVLSVVEYFILLRWFRFAR